MIYLTVVRLLGTEFVIALSSVSNSKMQRTVTAFKHNLRAIDVTSFEAMFLFNKPITMLFCV